MVKTEARAFVSVKCSELFAQQPCIATRTKLQMFKYKITLPASASMCNRMRHAYRVGLGDRYQSLRFGDEHGQMPRIVEFEEVARVVCSFQPVRFIDTAATDR